MAMDRSLFDSSAGVSSIHSVTVSVLLRSLEGGDGGRGVKLTPLDFFGFKCLPLDRLSKALAQLFLVCEHII